MVDVFSYGDLYKAGKQCYDGVRWKNSAQRFEMHLFSGTTRRRKLLLDKIWKPCPYVHFVISERGKTRPIDTPRIQDRQIHKVYTKEVLLPLYLSDMTWNNGASLSGKGFHFPKRLLREDLHYCFRRYGRNGNIILLDCKQFSPSASHCVIYARHDKLIHGYDLRKLGDDIVASSTSDKGMPLEAESSQAEVIAFPSPLDNYIKCQLSIKCVGHYMDDYYIIVPPNQGPREIMRLIVQKAPELDLTISKEKSRIVPLSKPFRYCKAKYISTKSGRVIVTDNQGNFRRTRRKIKTFYEKAQNGEMSYEDLWTSVNGMLAYLENYQNHRRMLRLRRLFHAIYGFSAEGIENFRAMERLKGAIHYT